MQNSHHPLEPKNRPEYEFVAVASTIRPVPNTHLARLVCDRFRVIKDVPTSYFTTLSEPNPCWLESRTIFRHRAITQEPQLNQHARPRWRGSGFEGMSKHSSTCFQARQTL